MKTHILPPLPFPMNALEPYISKETIEFHYHKHHQGYVDKLNQLLPGTPWENEPLEQIIQSSFQKEMKIFNQAAQVWNHSFYWNCLTPPQDGGGNIPDKKLRDALDRDFGSVDQFKEAFHKVAENLFGSGWAWLVSDANGTLRIEKTSNADNPLRKGDQPILTADVWEHAYYIDYRNARAKYLESLWPIFNWEFAARNYSLGLRKAAA